MISADHSAPARVNFTAFTSGGAFAGESNGGS